MQPANVQLTHADHTSSGRTFPLSILAQDVEDPANIGSLFRMADALGVRHLYLTGTSVTPKNPRARRAARAAQQYVPWSYSVDSVGLVRERKAQQVWVASLEITSNSTDVRLVQLPPQREVLLVVGAENAGVSQSVLDESDITVHIPMLGANSSMNLAVAAALAVFEMTRQLTLSN